MASEKQVELVRSGATEWNTWRTQNAMVDIDLGGVDLQGVDLRGANLQNGNFRQANLQGANLSGANLQGANLSNASLQGVNMMRAEMRNVSLAHANLQWANLVQADLQWADLHGANLRLANLQGADLGGGNLRDSNLLGANLKLVNLEDADLRNVLPRGLHQQIAEQNKQGADSSSGLKPSSSKVSQKSFELWAKAAFDAASRMLGVESDATDVLKAMSDHFRNIHLGETPTIIHKLADGKESNVHLHRDQVLQQNLLLIALQTIAIAQRKTENALSLAHLESAISGLQGLSWPFESLLKEKSDLLQKEWTI